MQRTQVNLLVDLAVAFVMFGLLLTGYVIKFVLPPGTNKDWMLWNMTRHQWGEVHFWVSVVLLFLIVVHLCLHWTWIATVIRQRLGLPKTTHQRTLPDGWWAVMALAFAFSGFAWIAHFGVQRVPRSHEETCHDDPIETSRQGVQEPLVEAPLKPAPTLTWNDVYPIFEKACLACHGPQKQRANFRVDQLDKLLTNTGKSAWIIPGKSEESPLIAIVSGRQEIALPSRHRLPDADVAQLRKWIDGGAP